MTETTDTRTVRLVRFLAAGAAGNATRRSCERHLVALGLDPEATIVAAVADGLVVEREVQGTPVVSLAADEHPPSCACGDDGVITVAGEVKCAAHAEPVD